jgi:hypothetical protein
VPRTALITTTTKAAPNVSLSAPTASGLETVCQNACRPSRLDSQTRAAIGRTTTTIRYVEITPTDRLVLARPSALTLRAILSADAATLLMRGASDGPLDRDHPAVVQVEPHLSAFRQPPKSLSRMLKSGRCCTSCASLQVSALQDRPHDRPVAVDRRSSAASARGRT